MRRPCVRSTVRRMMVVVGVAAVMLSLGRRAHKAIDDYLNPKGVFYYGVYQAPNGRITRGNIIFVRPDGVIFVD